MPFSNATGAAIGSGDQKAWVFLLNLVMNCGGGSRTEGPGHLPFGEEIRPDGLNSFCNVNHLPFTHLPHPKYSPHSLSKQVFIRHWQLIHLVWPYVIQTRWAQTRLNTWIVESLEYSYSFSSVFFFFWKLSSGLICLKTKYSDFLRGCFWWRYIRYYNTRMTSQYDVNDNVNNYGRLVRAWPDANSRLYIKSRILLSSPFFYWTILISLLLVLLNSVSMCTNYYLLNLLCYYLLFAGPHTDWYLWSAGLNGWISYNSVSDSAEKHLQKAVIKL